MGTWVHRLRVQQRAYRCASAHHSSEVVLGTSHMVLTAHPWPHQEPLESINLLTVQFGHKNIYANIHSSEIQALVDREINRLEFGKTAFVPNSAT